MRKTSIRRKGSGKIDFSEIAKKIQKRSQKFVIAVLADAEVRARAKTPIEYGVLVNSIFRDTSMEKTRMKGKLGYTADYAKYLNNKTNWSPRPASQKEGPADNMNAEPRFLDNAFESKEAKAAQKMLSGIFKL